MLILKTFLILVALSLTSCAHNQLLIVKDVKITGVFECRQVKTQDSADGQLYTHDFCIKRTMTIEGAARYHELTDSMDKKLGLHNLPTGLQSDLVDYIEKKQ